MVYTKGRGIEKQEKLTKLSFFPFLGASFFLLFGQMQYSPFSMKVFSVSLVLLWFLIALLENPAVFEKTINNKYSLMILFSLVLRFVLLAISPYGLANSVEYVMSRIAMYMPFFAFHYYQRTLTVRQFKFITYAVLTIWVGVIISILSYLKFDIELARQISGGLAGRRGFFGSLIDVSIGTGCIALALFGVRKRITDPQLQKRFKLLFCLFLVLYLVNGYYTQSFIAFFLAMVLLVMEWVLPNRDNNSNRLLWFAIVIFFVMFVLITQIGVVGDWFISMGRLFDGSIFEDKFIEIGTTLKGGEAVGNIEVRLKHLGTSIGTFLSRPIFGIAPEIGYGMDVSQIGFHSGVDMFARFGLAGALPVVWGYWKHLTGTIGTTGKFLTNKVAALFALYMLLAGWDRIEGFFAVVFIAPAIAYVAMKEQEQRETQTESDT